MSEELEHAGVKGMKWGVRKDARYNDRYTAARSDMQRKASSVEKRLGLASKSDSELRERKARITKRIDRLDSDRIVGGLGRGVKRSNVDKEAVKRGDKTPYQTLSAKEKSLLSIRDASRKTNRQLVKDLSVQIPSLAGVVGGSTLVMKLTNLSPELVRQGQISIAVLGGGHLVKTQIDAIRTYKTAETYEKLSDERALIDRELSDRAKKK